MIKTSPKASQLDSTIIREAALKLRAINNKYRQKILLLVMQKEKVTVTEIYKKLKFEQSVTSQHLAILRKHKYVITKRDGKFIYYTANVKEIKRIMPIVENLISA